MMSSSSSSWLEHISATNVALSVVIGYLVYKVFGFDKRAEQRKEQDRKKREEALGHDRVFTLKELRAYDGTKPSKEHGGEKPIYIAVDGVVFDMTSGADFYGPGGPYAGFAGHDATRGMATMAVGLVSEEWDDTSDLDEHERQTMLEWKEKFLSKYPVRGTLVKSK
ncbi:hypothetical protein PTSG_11680 [Salpingoeca rosetta]|uniref:Cytochrome b5 heme-binding domain-containing protein n=1 Tax=Salpingoeca rosetta (strain ATCC 50818 / BSB-021) TaxID=946362 RepID=F2TY98_SALR5|nr:uncharacterized protein PTSG_11680 [Salpingoeca rosetta]EGD76357.1 hypothetical protein PTSG_11680 [Salpingoeca rosetta]|eukprot:XP_004998532.1 hypothetical protein PTSG_11680 [Salpingoeca rosetta]